MIPELKTLLLQIVVVYFVARVLGWLFEKLRQPRVVGEILAGILLGPSLLGWLFPSALSLLFPAQGLGPFYSLSQIGLLLFMFQVGLTLDLQQVRKHGSAVILTSNVSVLLPLAAGVLLALFLHARLSSPAVPLSVFALFMGTAMSITAFPVLARILMERNLLQTHVGSVAISCASVDDVTAWCLLALLSARVHSSSGSSLGFALAGLATYVLLMIFVLRPVINRIQASREDKVTVDSLAILLIFMFFSAWTTEWLGVHALFGAFFAGVVLNRDAALARNVAEKLGTVTTVLLPLFFAFTGLRTSVRLLNGSALWFYCFLIILVAVLGKLVGSAVSARSMGMEWRAALSVGILMNTRGLVELVILNVGLDLGVISPTLFSMMVIMALVTTLMTTPLLDLLERPQLTDSSSARIAQE